MYFTKLRSKLKVCTSQFYKAKVRASIVVVVDRNVKCKIMDCLEEPL